MINKMMNKIKIKFKYQINQFKQRVNEYVQLKNSIETLSNSIKKYYVLPNGFDEIYKEINNTKRFKLYILVLIVNWITAFYHLIWITSDYIWLKTDGEFLPDRVKVCLSGIVILLCFASIFKTELILGQIKHNLSPLKVIYQLMTNDKESHKLTDRNYNRLAILTRIVITLTLNYAGPKLIFLAVSLESLFAYRSCQLYWLMYGIIMTPIYTSIIMVYSTATAVLFIFIFHIINSDLTNSMIKSKQLFQKEKEKLLISKLKNNYSV